VARNKASADEVIRVRGAKIRDLELKVRELESALRESQSAASQVSMSTAVGHHPRPRRSY
jgi:hypothetical protein